MAMSGIAAPGASGSTILALALVLGARDIVADFPKDLVPMIVVTGQASRVYPVFSGLTMDNGSAPQGLDLQRLLRINQTLYIAARDHLFSFDLGLNSQEGLIPRRVLTWKTRARDVRNCAMRGKLPGECHNFIRVLVPQDDRTLFVCGTNAFNPICRSYKMNSLLQEGRDMNGQARCPFESKQTNVALFAGGDLYSATMADFLASDAVIYRSVGDNPILRTVKYDSKWLKEPNFVHVIDYGHYVYIFFREIAIESTGLGRVVFSRVARVCKNDKGGSPRVLEKYWTSFLKVRLNCSIPGQTFFYFDVLESLTDVVNVHGLPTVIGIFSTQSNSIPGSAVCAYLMQDIEDAFNGPFKEQRSTDSSWTAVPEDRIPKPRPGSCAGHGEAQTHASSQEFPDESLSFIKLHPLMDSTVPTDQYQPWLTWTRSWSKLVRVVVDTAAGPHQNYTVLFLATEDGRLLKVLTQMETRTQTEKRGQLRAVILEEVDVYNPERCAPGQQTRWPLAVELDKDHHAIYVAFAACVLRVPLSRCHVHGRCKSACIASRDPYCGWRKEGRCSTLHPGTRSGFEQDVERGHLVSQEQCEGLAPSAQDSLQDSTCGVQGGKRPHDSNQRVHLNLLIAATTVSFLLGALLATAALSWRRRRRRRSKRGMSHAGLDDPSLPCASAEAKMDAGPHRVYTPLLLERGGAGPGGVRTGRLGLSALPTPDSTPDLPAKTLRPFRSQWDRPLPAPGDTGLTAYPQSIIPSAVVLPNNVLGRQLAGEVQEEQKEKARSLEQESEPPPLPFRLPPKMADAETLDELLQRLHEMNLQATGQAGIREEVLGPIAGCEEGEEEEEEEEEESYRTAATLPRDGASVSAERPSQSRSLSTFPKASLGLPSMPMHGSYAHSLQYQSRPALPHLGLQGQLETGDYFDLPPLPRSPSCSSGQ